MAVQFSLLQGIQISEVTKHHKTATIILIEKQ